jgi:hypothetical protein
MTVAVCAGTAAYAERLWQPRPFGYFLGQCQKVHKKKKHAMLKETSSTFCLETKG